MLGMAGILGSLSVALFAVETPAETGSIADKETAEKKEDERSALFVPSEFPKGWVHYSAEKNSPLGTTWKVEPAPEEKDAVLVCLGRPFGYLRTEKVYENFEFSLEWKYPNDPNANSGILVFTSGPDMIWPQAVQIQLHRPTAGSVFPDGGARTENTAAVNDLNLPINEWHRLQIHCVDGRIAVTINGRKTAEVTGCVPSKGAISIQSEGSEIHFRHIHLRELKGR